jgi:hypothetical protein
MPVGAGVMGGSGGSEYTGGATTFPNGKGAAGAGAGGGKIGVAAGGATTAGPTGAVPGATTAGAARVGAGSFGQMKKRSPVGSIRGPCQAAQPAIITAHAATNAVKERRVGTDPGISALTLRAHRATDSRAAESEMRRGPFGGRG